MDLGNLNAKYTETQEEEVCFDSHVRNMTLPKTPKSSATTRKLIV